MEKFKTEQEEFWAGQFGDEYTNRNQGDNIVASNLSLFSTIFSNTNKINNILEFGANIGLNLIAVKKLLPNAEISAIEINNKAIKELKKNKSINKIYAQSILDFKIDYQRDLVFSKGVLIHINPEELNNVYDKIYNSSKKYICIIEYYNPIPVNVKYRGYDNKLFKRDFAGELLEKYKDLELVKYGFVYHRDNLYPQDDLTWFLLKK